MKRTVVALCILAVIFAMWFAERRIIDTTCDEIYDSVNAIKGSIEKNGNIDKEKAEFLKKWEKAEKRFDALMTHEDADEINLLTIRLERNILIGDYNSALSVAEEIKWHIKDMSEKSKVDITTVF